MTYDKKYYEDRRAKIQIKYAEKTDKLIRDMTDLLNEFYKDKNDLGIQLKEVETRMLEGEEKGNNNGNRRTKTSTEPAK